MSVSRVFDPLPIIDAKGTIFAFHEDVSRSRDLRQECGKPIKTNGRASREKRLEPRSANGPPHAVATEVLTVAREGFEHVGAAQRR